MPSLSWAAGLAEGRWSQSYGFSSSSSAPDPYDRSYGDGERRSLLDLSSPIRSHILFAVVGDLLCYSGANEVNAHLGAIRNVCRELRDQIDEECFTFNYDDACGLSRSIRSEQAELALLNSWIRRHPRLRHFECVLRSASTFRAMLQGLELPDRTRCSFVLEFKVKAEELRWLFRRFRVRRLNMMPEESAEPGGGMGHHGGRASSSSSGASPGSHRAHRSSSAAASADWLDLPEMGQLRILCLRSCPHEIVKAFLRSCQHLQGFQVADCQLLSDPGIASSRLASLSLTGVATLPDEQFSRAIAGCQNLRSLYISKCHISYFTVALPRLELLSVTHCRQLTDQCASELTQPSNNPSLRFLDLTEDRGLVSPVIAHQGLEIAWLMHCPQLSDSAVEQMFESCFSLTAANLVQSSIESALISSATLRTLELTTSQKLTDAAVTELLQHCPNLNFLDVGHCCQLLEPRFAHANLETVLLSFCVNLKENAVTGLFENCPSLRYVELAVCMFDMGKFQKECSPNCQVVVNFDF